MLFAEGFQAGRADFLFSFEDKLDVIFQQFVLDEIFEGFDLDKDCPLSSSAPRAQMYPSRTSGSKGWLFHSSSGSAGITS